MKNIVLSSLLLVALLFFSSCSSDSPVNPDQQIPTVYDSTTYNTAIQMYAQTLTNFNLYVNEIKKGRVSGTQVQAGTLTSLFNQGSISLNTLTSAYYKEVIQNSIQELARASGGTYDPVKTVQENGQGGVYGAYLFDEYGLEHEQLLEKGFFMSGMYNEVFTNVLADNSVTAVDRAINLFGAHYRFANSGTATKHQFPDVYTANYAARRDDNSGNGLYFACKKNFIEIRHWTVNQNTEKRTAAINELKKNWEKVIAATAINYGYDVVAKLSKTSPTVTDISGALHSLSELIGFVKGMKGLSGLIITEPQINEILSLVNAPVDGTATPYLFVKEPQSLTKLTSVVTKLQGIYGFTPAEMDLFKRNLVTEQSR
ncbi:MAG: hypothetical protein JNL36_02910 [Candidatus Kapabacteria bacterium]|nr:hypothetical protein [Candidatus Kapabacteria bacterium]